MGTKTQNFNMGCMLSGNDDPKILLVILATYPVTMAEKEEIQNQSEFIMNNPIKKEHKIK